MNKRTRGKRTQYTAELIPITVYKGEVEVGNGYILIRDDGMESRPTLRDMQGDLLPEGSYTMCPFWHMKYLVVVPKVEVH